MEEDTTSCNFSKDLEAKLKSFWFRYYHILSVGTSKAAHNRNRRNSTHFKSKNLLPLAALLKLLCHVIRSLLMSCHMMIKKYGDKYVL